MPSRTHTVSTQIYGARPPSGTHRAHLIRRLSLSHLAYPMALRTDGASHSGVTTQGRRPHVSNRRRRACLRSQCTSCFLPLCTRALYLKVDTRRPSPASLAITPVSSVITTAYRHCPSAPTPKPAACAPSFTRSTRTLGRICTNTAPKSSTAAEAQSAHSRAPPSRVHPPSSGPRYSITECITLPGNAPDIS